MKNLISIVEIPTTNFSRAVSFYQEVFEIRIEEVDMVSTKLGVMPSSEETVNVVLVHGENYTPSMDGALLYFDAGEDLKKRLLSVEAAGGQVIAPKTEISPEMGFFAHFIDTEGNKIGLHGMK
ncbi:UNVERIFIED_CONTAM: hypothetical protein GTU68_035767 [Idotea baltica]|nr:hypothetical protein [Idotea baltica]